MSNVKNMSTLRIDFALAETQQESAKLYDKRYKANEIVKSLDKKRAALDKLSDELSNELDERKERGE